MGLKKKWLANGWGRKYVTIKKLEEAETIIFIYKVIYYIVVVGCRLLYFGKLHLIIMYAYIILTFLHV